jgi:hypothetical protein
MRSKKYVLQKLDINVHEREKEKNRLLEKQRVSKRHIEQLRTQMQKSLDIMLASTTNQIESINKSVDIDPVKKGLDISRLKQDYAEYEYDKKTEFSKKEFQFYADKSNLQVDAVIDDDSYQIPKVSDSYDVFIRDPVFSTTKCIIIYILKNNELVNPCCEGWDYKIGEGYLSLVVQSKEPSLRSTGDNYNISYRLYYETVSNPEGTELVIFYD